MSQFLANESVKQEISRLHHDAKTALNFAHAGDLAFTIHLLQKLEQSLKKLSAGIRLDHGK